MFHLYDVLYTGFYISILYDELISPKMHHCFIKTKYLLPVRKYIVQILVVGPVVKIKTGFRGFETKRNPGF